MFDIDVERCACGGQLKIIAAIEEPVVIVRILMLLGLPARAPPRPRRESFRSTTQPDSLTGAKKRRFYGRIDGRARPAVA